MKKIYYLSTCDTCKRIMKELAVDEGWEKQDIKTDKITEAQLDTMADMAGSYEALFSRTARKYRDMQLKENELNENDYRDLILSEYTFLKRPVIILNNNIFIGNSKPTVEAARQAMENY